MEVSILKKMKVAELKNYIKKTGIEVRHISKLKKDQLIECINHHRRCAQAKLVIAAFVKKHWRPYLIRKCEQLRVNHSFRDQCVNEIDFYTLEPLSQIPDKLFYCVCENNFYYGFNVFSLSSLIKHRHTSYNPFSREVFPETTRKNVMQLVRLLFLLEPLSVLFAEEDNEDEEETTVATVSTFQPPANRFLGNNIYPPREGLNADQIELVNKLTQLRRLSLERRIDELFIEIDLLGNYTKSTWIKNLSKTRCIRMFHILHDYWEHENISRNIKWSICSLTGDPFYNIIIHNFNNLTDEQILEGLVLVMENMVYTGVDLEYRKIGALQVIVNLVRVSEEARHHFFWLT
jgi:hypothetical protein